MKHLMLYEAHCILGEIETVKISNNQGQSLTGSAQIDTGSLSSCISKKIAAELKLPVVDQKLIWSVLGKQNMTFVECRLNISGTEIKTVAVIADTSDLKYDIYIGRKDIKMIDGVIDLKKNTILNNIPNSSLGVQSTEISSDTIKSFSDYENS